MSQLAVILSLLGLWLFSSKAQNQNSDDSLEYAYVDSINQNINSWIYDKKIPFSEKINLIDQIIESSIATYGDNSEATAFSLHKKGVIYIYMGYDGITNSYDSAINYFSEAIKIREYLFRKDSIELLKDIINGYNLIGRCFLNKGDKQNSLVYFNKALSFIQTDSQKNALVSLYLRLRLEIARTYIEIGDYDQAVNNLNSVINYSADILNNDVLKEILEWQIRATIESGGLFANKLYDPDKAKSYLSIAKRLLEKQQVDNQQLISSNYYNNLGISYYRQNDFDSAIICYQISRRKNLRLNRNSSVADNLINLAACYNKKNRYDSSQYFLERANEIYLNFNQNLNIPLVYDNKADILYSKGDYKNSLQMQNLAIKYLVNNFNPADIFDNPIITKNSILDKEGLLFALRSKVKCFLQLNELEYLKRAYESSIVADQVIGMMRSEFQAEASRMSLASYAKPIYEQGIEACYLLYQLNHQDSILEKAFEFSEKSRAITLLDAVRKTKASARVDQELIKNEKSLNLRVNYFEKKAALQEQDSSQRTHYNVYDSLLYYRRQHQDVIDQIREATPEYYSLIFNQETTSVDKIQNTLPNDRCLIEYFMGDSSLYTFVIHKDTTFFLKRSDPDSVRRWVSEWVSAVQSLDAGFLQPSYRLHQALIKPGQDKKTLTPKITIVPDDVLNLVNFEALVTELPDEKRIYLPSFDHYLLYQHQLSYAFSATTSYETKPSKKDNQSSYLGVAPELTEGFQLEENWFDKLEYNQEEVLQAASLFPRNNIVAPGHSKDQFIRLAPSYGLIHCATHAMANNKDGDLSFILFGEEPNDIMYAKDLYALDLNANLVVLSACQTSAGELNRGEGIISLARGFTYAGAASVVTSLWNVREKTNKEIIYEFYRLLNKGEAKDEALRNAKINYLKNIQTETQMNAHPYFWAPLIFIGDSEPLQSGYSRSIITASVLFLILIIALIYKFRKKSMTV